MHWAKRDRAITKGVYYRFSHADNLRKQNKSSPEFEFMLNNLTLEEIIALKLELTSKSINYKLSGMKLWASIPFFCKQAMLNYAASICKSHHEAALFLGLDYSQYLEILKKYGSEELLKLKAKR
jgi:hypothetical protein